MLAVALCLEVLIVALFDLAVLADPGPQGLSLVGFNPSVAFGAAAGAALTFSVAAFVGFESAAIYSEECRDPRRTVARATFIAVGLLGAAAGPDTIVNPSALVKAGYATAGNPDPTTVLFIAGAHRLGALWNDAASLLFATSLFAALLSFHNAVARYAFALGREGVISSVFGRVHPRSGAPWIASLSQSVLALSVVGIFALVGADPVLQLFTWLTNLRALGVLLLMTVASFAGVGYFRRRPEPELSRWSSMMRETGRLRAAFGHEERYMLHEGDVANPVDRHAEVFASVPLPQAVDGLQDPQRRTVQAWIERTLANTRSLTESLRAAPEFELLHDPMLSTVCFRHVPPGVGDLDAHNLQLAREMQRDGRVFLAPASVDGRACLRACFVNFRTTLEEVACVLPVARKLGRRLARG